MIDDTLLNLKWLYFCHQLILGFGKPNLGHQRQVTKAAKKRLRKIAHLPL